MGAPGILELSNMAVHASSHWTIDLDKLFVCAYAGMQDIWNGRR